MIADDFEPSDVKERVIRESTKLFLANGFRGTSVKEITEAVGIGRGTLYWYFRSKDEILETIFKRFERLFVDGMIETVQSCRGDFPAKYRALYKFCTEFARDNRELSLASGTLLNEFLGSNSEIETLLKSIYDRYRHFVETILDEGKEEGAVHESVDTGLYAHIICASLAGMLVQWFLNEKSLEVGGFVRIFRDIILRGVTTGETG